ncbi:EAL domain-containing protein [Shewanella sp. S1-49-MNA-CIBAN-0167]|uniref:EAL domain-containing protein n=1 Tax=Shewanella sp. S1-49-MNA-CIBAN-0167 TaxID=3140468 RepID=UPI003322F8BE
MFEKIMFSHAFQPIIDITRETIVSYEVLLRGVNNEPPGFIFNKINKSNLMSFDQYNREKALELAARLGLDCALNINFTPDEIIFEGGLYITATLEKAKSLGFNPKQLVIEITEGEFIHDIDLLASVLNKLRSESMVIAIDDFGSAYSGLNMLAEIQPDLIKLDMSLLRDIDHHGPRQAIVKGIYSVCTDLGIDVLAEGVESEGEFNFLRNIGVKLYQGYFFAKPGFECLPQISNSFDDIRSNAQTYMGLPPFNRRAIC